MTLAASASSGSRVRHRPASRCTTARTRRSRPGCGRGTCRTRPRGRGHRRAGARTGGHVARVAPDLHRPGRLRCPQLRRGAVPAQRRLAAERVAGAGRRRRLVPRPDVVGEVEPAGDGPRLRRRRRPAAPRAAVARGPRSPVGPRLAARLCASCVSPARVSAAYAALISAIRRVARCADSGSSPVRSGWCAPGEGAPRRLDRRPGEAPGSTPSTSAVPCRASPV